MTSHQEIEVINHNAFGFKVFLVSIIYRAPHLHKDFEISCVLEGTLEVSIMGKVRQVHEGELFVVNPYEVHELKSIEKVLLLSLQISREFFLKSIPKIEGVLFSEHFITFSKIRENFQKCQNLSQKLIDLTYFSLKNTKNWELLSYSLIFSLFYDLFNICGTRLLSAKARFSNHSRIQRIIKLVEQIDTHYNSKLLLSDLAERENLSLHYLSHFFKENFGMSFLDYLFKIRCEQAKFLLMNTDNSLLDICYSCGFSDPKYFNKRFSFLYGCTPKEYRKENKNTVQVHSVSKKSSQQFLSDSYSVQLLEKHRKENSIGRCSFSR